MPPVGPIRIRLPTIEFMGQDIPTHWPYTEHAGLPYGQHPADRLAGYDGFRDHYEPLSETDRRYFAHCPPHDSELRQSIGCLGEPMVVLMRRAKYERANEVAEQQERRIDQRALSPSDIYGEPETWAERIVRSATEWTQRVCDWLWSWRGN